MVQVLNNEIVETRGILRTFKRLWSEFLQKWHQPFGIIESYKKGASSYLVPPVQDVHFTEMYILE